METFLPRGAASRSVTASGTTEPGTMGGPFFPQDKDAAPSRRTIVAVRRDVVVPLPLEGGGLGWG
jgi:hypothetical protein